jgi:hypothetical protein
MGKDAQRRPRRIEARPLAEATQWLETYRKFWEGNFKRLDDLLEEMKFESATPKKEKNHGSKNKQSKRTKNRG